VLLDHICYLPRDSGHSCPISGKNGLLWCWICFLARCARPSVYSSIRAYTVSSHAVFRAGSPVLMSGAACHRYWEMSQPIQTMQCCSWQSEWPRDMTSSPPNKVENPDGPVPRKTGSQLTLSARGSLVPIHLRTPKARPQRDEPSGSRTPLQLHKPAK
jgi:hypothetical protein